MHIHKWGLLAEYIVLIRYILKGYMPVKHRWKSKHGEIDLIFKKATTIIFCEVKARSGDFFIENPVSINQQRRIIRAGQKFLSINRAYNNYNVRFDLIVVKSLFKHNIYRNWISD